MYSDFMIRAYHPSDLDSVINLLKLNTPQYFAPIEEKDFIHYLNHEIELYFVVEYENAIVACGGCNFSQDKTVGIISWDIVHPDFQGKGIGSRLLKYRIDLLKMEYYMVSNIVRTSQFTYKFYEKLGFERKEIVENYWAQDFHLYRMEYK
ncbi:MAG: GNAT family N-acetyltransferase [Bacteroidetes bacterium]|nr:GNAT family N-acetyltransferase [Bacteroidota bacterium]